MSYKLDLDTVTDVIMNVSMCCSLDRGRAEGKESSGGEKRMKKDQHKCNKEEGAREAVN